ncbi:transcriptional regulator [Parafrankia soli]|uniref:Transcriptional regulator n=1 Tax=Parafrankia soli TaxID=2599596 RepID=A0A1S1QQG3_9ACTN|nr:BTAD domain-containing putative transcriptional regulator [Parafrankia soli]OHV35525.1 transcriptional regulator [Parafrankia soli]
MRIQVLGPVEVLLGGAPLDLGPPKQRALLALLLAAGDTVIPVETIIERLWDGQPPASATASLQVYVSNLRRLLEPERDPRARATVLVTQAPGYVLRTGAAEVDARQFVAAIGAARGSLEAGRPAEALPALDAALALWRGDAYADVRDASWIRPEAGRLEELRQSAVEDRARALVELGRHDEAAADLEALTARHPLRERAWGLFALAIYRCGRPAEALAALRAARAHLAEELGVDPGPELAALELAILRHDPALAWTGGAHEPPAAQPAAAQPAVSPTTGLDGPRPVLPDVSPAGAGAPEPSGPFVGRDEALAALLAAIPTPARRGRVVLVDGEPGVGKTRLVAELGRRCGRLTAWGACPEHEVAPALWPWEQSLRAVAAARPDVPVPPGVAALIDQRAQEPGGYDAAGARLRLYEGVAGYLAAAAPLVIVLDDLHWADVSSLRLLAHVGGAAPRGVMVIGTFRTHEAGALADTRAALARSGCERLRLDGLDDAAVRELMRATTGTDPGPETASALRSRTAGNPFFIGELVRLRGPGRRGLAGPGAAGPATDRGAEQDRAQGALPDHVRDVLSRRVARLPEPAAALLATAAVAGGEFDADVVAQVAGHTFETSLDLLDAALAAGLITEAGDRLGRFRFSHSLVREALDAGHSRLRRAHLHRRYGEVTAERYAGRPERAGEVARHWLAAAELGAETARAATEHAARAARAAADRLAPEDAAGYWQEALAAAELAGADRGTRLELLLGLVSARYAAGQLNDGLDVVDRALDEAGDDPHLIVRVAEAAMGGSPWFPFPYGTDRGRLHRALERALGGLPAAGRDRALAVGCLAVLESHVGRMAEAERAGALAVAAARDVADDPALLPRVLHLRSLTVTGVDYAEHRHACARELASLPSTPPELLVGAHLTLVDNLVRFGHVARARVALDEADTMITRLGSPTLAYQAAIMRAALLAFSGELEESADVATAAVGRLGLAAQNGVESSFVANVIDRALQAGTLARLADTLARSLASTGIEALRGSLALALAAAGRPEAGRAALAEMRLPPRDYTWLSAVVMRLNAAVALGVLDTVEEDIAHLRPHSGELASLGTCTAVVGAVDSHLGEAYLALGDHMAAREHLTAALALLEANDSPYWTARAHQALAKCP